MDRSRRERLRYRGQPLIYSAGFPVGAVPGAGSRRVRASRVRGTTGR
jgi:hypothetical protein